MTEEQLGMQALAHDFAREQMLPHAAKWDEQKIFPVEVMREAAKLGFAGETGGLTMVCPLLCQSSTSQQYNSHLRAGLLDAVVISSLVATP